MRGPSSPSAIGAARSSRSTVRGTVRRSPRRATAWRSCPSGTASRSAATRRSRTAFGKRTARDPSTARWAWRWGRTGRCISRTTRPARSGGWCTEGGRGRQQAARAAEVAGYSGKPLVQKLGIKDGWAVAILNAPKEYARTLGKLPSGVTRKSSPVGPVDFIQFFTKEKRELERRFAGLARALAPAGMLWISRYFKFAQGTGPLYAGRIRTTRFGE